MIIQTKVKADWEFIKKLKWNYHCDLAFVVKKKYVKSYKLENPIEGPCEISAVHENSNVNILRGIYKERINIRRIKPYHNASEQKS